MVGVDLIEFLIESCGLPKESSREEIHALLARKNIAPENVTIENLREIFSEYLQDTLLEANNRFSAS